MSAVLSGFFVVWSVIGLGYVLGRQNLLGPHGQKVLAALAFYVASPPLLFVTISRADVAHIFSAPLAVAAVSGWATMVGYALVARFVLHRPAAAVVMGAQSAGQVNSANLGIPIAMFVLQDASQVAPVMLFQLALNTPLYLTVMDALTAADGAGPGSRPTPASVLLGVVRNPMIVGSGLGILFGATGWQLPALVLEPIEIVAGAAIPAMLLAFGISLVGSHPLAGDGPRVDTVLASLAKLVLHPLLAFGVGVALGLQGPGLYAVVVMAALPTAQNVYVAAVRYDRAVTLSRDAVLVTTAVSVLTMTVIALVLT